MDDSLSGRQRSWRPWSRRPIASQGHGSTVSLPSTSPLPAESAQAPFVSRNRWASFVAKFFGWRPKGPSRTSRSHAQTSETLPGRSWFKRLVSSRKAPPAERGPSSVPAPLDPTPPRTTPPPTVPDPVPASSEAQSTVPEPPAIPPKSPPEQAQEALERGGRLSPGSASFIERVPGTWEATASTAESWEGVASKISAFAGIVDAIGDVHPYLKVATGVINAAFKPIVSQVQRDKNFEELLQEMTVAYDRVIREAGSVARLKERPRNRQTALLEKICMESQKCALFIQNEYIRKFGARAAKNAWAGGGVDEQIDQYKASFSSLRVAWQEEVQDYQRGESLLDKLSPMRHSGHTSQRACLPDTRVAVLTFIDEWIDNPDSHRILFVLGVAGSGKSSIAHTVARTHEKRGELGCFFAFKRDDGTHVPERLLGTVAHHLAHWDEGYRDELVRILGNDPKLADSPDIMDQWDRLIVQPAAKVSSAGPVLVAIDALDECPESHDSSRQRLLDCLTLRAAELSDTIRVLVTSRPLDTVSQAMIAPSVSTIDLSRFAAVEDVRLYVRSQLLLPGKEGLSASQCDDVANAADGLFQWAATACRFLRGKLAGRTMSAKFKDSLELLVHGGSGIMQPRDGPPSLDRLYADVLEDAFDMTDTTVIANFRSVVATMLCARKPLPIDVLQLIHERALPSSSGVVKSVLGSMGVVLEGVSNLSSPVRPMHLSFREFLLDSSRSGTQWHITEAHIAHGHRILALGGLRIMASDLRFNMHSLQSSLSSGKEELEKKPCPHPTLAYITPNLHRHLCKVLNWGLRDKNRNIVRGAWRRLLYNKLLFWIEWSLIRNEWDVMGATLTLALRMLQGKDRRFAEDADLLRDLLGWMDHLPPPHVYISGLAFASAKSLVRQHFMPHFRGIPTVRPLRETWKEIHEVPLSIDKPCLAWSTDCRYIRENGRFPSRCWDARTGDPVDVPSNVDWRYASLASADGRVNVSFSRIRSRLVANVQRSLVAREANTTSVRFAIEIPSYWDQDDSDPDTGSDADDETGSYCDDYNADVSPDGNWLVVVNSEGYLGLWDLRIGLRAKSVPEYVADGQLAAIFSPDSREIVSSGIWDDVHYVFPIDQGTDGGDIQSVRWANVNFKPQAQIDANEEKFPDTDLRCTEPDICVPHSYFQLICHPGVRLVLGGLRVDYTDADACYGTEWANCYAGTIEAKESEDEYAGVDVEMEESKVESSGSKGKRDEMTSPCADSIAIFSNSCTIGSMPQIHSRCPETCSTCQNI